MLWIGPVYGPCVSPASIVERLWTPPLVSRFEMGPRSAGARQEQAKRRNSGRMADQSETAPRPVDRFGENRWIAGEEGGAFLALIHRRKSVDREG